MYQCDIAFTGDDNPLNASTTVSVTINSTTFSFAKTIQDFGAITGNLNQALQDASITCVGALVSTTTNQSDMPLNTGYIQVLIQIFYPSEALTGSIEMNINGAPQTFNFVKIPTS